MPSNESIFPRWCSHKTRRAPHCTATAVTFPSGTVEKTKEMFRLGFGIVEIIVRVGGYFWVLDESTMALRRLFFAVDNVRFNLMLDHVEWMIRVEFWPLGGGRLGRNFGGSWWDSAEGWRALEVRIITTIESSLFSNKGFTMPSVYQPFCWASSHSQAAASSISNWTRQIFINRFSSSIGVSHLTTPFWLKLLSFRFQEEFQKRESLNRRRPQHVHQHNPT